MTWTYVYFDGPKLRKKGYNDLDSLLEQASRDLDDLDIGDTKTRREPEGVQVIDLSSGKVIQKWKRGELLERIEQWEGERDECDGEVGERDSMDEEEGPTSIETGFGSDVT